MERDKDILLHRILLIIGLAVLVWSGIGPRDRLTWFLEISPVVIALPLLLATYRRFRFSNLAYVLILSHAIILMIGGHWTYSEMPLFSWLRDELGLSRNYYDLVGHVVQGFVPAILAREVLLRTSPLRPGKWLSVIVVTFCLAISAGYELFEWGTAMILGQDAEQFLATQGDPWDTQWDMCCALLGAIASLALLRHSHDKSMSQMRMSDNVGS